MNEKLHDAAALQGLTITEITVNRGDDYDDNIIILTSDGRRWKMCHYQDCCEQVCIDKITGILSDLIGRPLIAATETTDSEGWPDDTEASRDESYTWTTYRFTTDAGTVSIRWFGTSNGYYSESVSLDEIT